MRRAKCLLIFLAVFSVATAKNSYTVTNNALVLPASIQFDQHAYDVKDTLDPMLDLVADYLKENPSITKLRIEGHVYTEKSPEANIKLSLQRAAMVSYYLTTKGIDCSRLVPVAFGDTKPIAPTDECNLLTNTRIEFFNAEMYHRAVPGNAVDGYALKVFDPCDN
jgi:OOP family OmpA-OmpF porin